AGDASAGGGGGRLRRGGSGGEWGGAGGLRFGRKGYTNYAPVHSSVPRARRGTHRHCRVFTPCIFDAMRLPITRTSLSQQGVNSECLKHNTCGRSFSRVETAAVYGRSRRSHVVRQFPNSFVHSMAGAHCWNRRSCVPPSSYRVSESAPSSLNSIASGGRSAPS